MRAKLSNHIIVTARRLYDYIDKVIFRKIRNTDTAYSKDVPAFGYKADVQEIDGKSVKSKNFLNLTWPTIPSSIDIVTNNDGSYTITNNGGSSAVWLNGGWETTVKSIELPNGDYVANDCDVRLYNATEQSWRTSRRFTITNNVYVTGAYYYSNANTTVTIRPQIEEGTEATEYEPYFEGIRHASVDSVDVVGKNLLPYADITRDSAGYSLNEDACNIPKGAYTFSTITTSNTGESAFILLDENKINVASFTINNTWQPAGRVITRALNLTKNVAFISVYHNSASGYINSMIEKGTTATPYIPYKAESHAIPTAITSLDGYGWGINDEVRNYVDFERGKFVKMVGRVDLGSLIYSEQGTGYDGNLIFIGANIPNSEPPIALGLCDNIKIINSTSWASTKENSINLGHLSVTMFISIKDVTTVTDLYEKLNGIYLYYRLATPNETNIYSLIEPFEVEGGGTVTMHQAGDFEIPVKSTVDFYTKEIL